MPAIDDECHTCPVRFACPVWLRWRLLNDPHEQADIKPVEAKLALFLLKPPKAPPWLN